MRDLINRILTPDALASVFLIVGIFAVSHLVVFGWASY
jgi:hypothetical protein